MFLLRGPRDPNAGLRAKAGLVMFACMFAPPALLSAWRSDGLHAIPDRDLRVAAASDMLHVVPARPARGIARLWTTHPRLEARVNELERLERRLQS